MLLGAAQDSILVPTKYQNTNTSTKNVTMRGSIQNLPTRTPNLNSICAGAEYTYAGKFSKALNGLPYQYHCTGASSEALTDRPYRTQPAIEIGKITPGSKKRQGIFSTRI